MAKQTVVVRRVVQKWSAVQLLAVLLGVPKSMIREDEATEFLLCPVVHLDALRAEDMEDLCALLARAPKNVFSGAPQGIQLHTDIRHWRAHADATTRVAESWVRLGAVEWVDGLRGALSMAEVPKVGRELRGRLRAFAAYAPAPVAMAFGSAEAALGALMSVLGLHSAAAVAAWAAAPIFECSEVKAAQVAAVLPAAAELLPALGFPVPVQLVFDVDGVASAAAFTIVTSLLALAPLQIHLSGVEPRPMRVAAVARAATVADEAGRAEAQISRNVLNPLQLSPDLDETLRLVVERRFWPEAERIPPPRLSDLLALFKFVGYTTMAFVSVPRSPVWRV